MGLPEGHPEKDGVLVDLGNLPAEIKKRLDTKQPPSPQDEVVEKLTELKTAE